MQTEINDFFSNKPQDDYFSEGVLGSQLANVTNIAYLNSQLIDKFTAIGIDRQPKYITFKNNKKRLANEMSIDYFGTEYKNLNNYQKNIICDNAKFVNNAINAISMLKDQIDLYGVKGVSINPHNKKMSFLSKNFSNKRFK